MQLTAKDVEEFQEAWKRDFGENIAFETARIRAAQVLDLCLRIIKHTPRDHPKQ